MLGMTHQMGHKKITGSVWGGTGWYLVELGQYGAELVGTWWYWVSITWYLYSVSKVLFACMN